MRIGTTNSCDENPIRSLPVPQLGTKRTDPMNKHRIKGWVRGGFAWTVWHSGLWRLFARWSAPRMIILAGHCVGHVRGLPKDMTIGEERLHAIIRALSKGFRWQTIGEGFQALRSENAPRGLAALSFDDGYRDNWERLRPILEATGARATVFLEGRPLTERKVSWSHQFFWLIHQRGVPATEIAQELARRGGHAFPQAALVAAADGPGDAARKEYLVKRILKYDCEAGLRDEVLRELFLERGGDEARLCDELYMDLDMAQELQAQGIELGGHTYSHEVLASLSEALAAREIDRGERALVECGLRTANGHPPSFAYPYGRRWDFREAESQAVERAGYGLAVTTHPGVVTRASDPWRLPRVMIDDETSIAAIMCEASGAFAWLRRLGLDLTE